MPVASTLPPGAMAVGSQTTLPVLGYLTWFSVPDRPVGVKHLRKQWLIAGLDPKPLPPDPRPLSLFKRAMREQDGRAKKPDGSYIDTDVRVVDENGDFCIYQISRVVRDRENREVDYPKAMRVIYTKSTEEIKFDALGDVSRIDLLPMMNAITDYFEQNTKVIRGPKVRTLVRQFIRDQPDEQAGIVGLGGENLRGKGGGVYFVAAKYRDDLDALETVLENLHEDGAAYLHKVPLADTTSERELIRRHHLDNTKREIAEAISETAALLKNRTTPVRADSAAVHWRRLRQLQRRAADYRALLRDENEDIVAESAMLEKQLDKLAAEPTAEPTTVA